MNRLIAALMPDIPHGDEDMPIYRHGNSRACGYTIVGRARQLAEMVAMESFPKTFVIHLNIIPPGQPGQRGWPE